LRGRERVSQFVDFNNVWDVAAVIGEPDKPAREDQTQQPKTASGDLPVALAENEIGVSFVPFATRFEIWVALHANASPRKSEIHTSKCGSQDLLVEQVPCHWGEKRAREKRMRGN
jgi:hypothetical protein